MNKEEFTRCVLEAESSLYRVAKSISVNESDCEDAVQEAILTAYEKLGTLKEEKFHGHRPGSVYETSPYVPAVRTES